MQIRAKASSAASFRWEFGDADGVLVQEPNDVPLTTSFTTFSFNLPPLSKFFRSIDVNTMRVNIIFFGSVTFTISYLELWIPVSSQVPITLKEDTTFVLSFSLMLDGFNETKLIYDKPYGRVVASAPTISP